MARYVKAEPGEGHSVIYTDEQGKRFRFSGGTWTWRNHNPGNIRPPRKHKITSKIGVAGNFLVFPDYATGHQALINLLSINYRNESIHDVVKKYAPLKDHNNIVVYEKFLRDKTGVQDNRKIKDFTPQEFEKLWHAIETMEGSKEGVIVEIKTITSVQKDKDGVIASYYVDPLGWIPKETAIQLAQDGEVDAVVCTSRSGNVYLRARPDYLRKNNFSNLD